MGISRLESIIRNSSVGNNQQGGIVKISLKDLPIINNDIRIVVIDTSEFIYKSIIGGDHTSGILNFLEKIFRCQIMPIFVFDGKPPKEKNKIIEERKRVKERARERVLSIQDQIITADGFLTYVESQNKPADNIIEDIDINIPPHINDNIIVEDNVFEDLDNSAIHSKINYKKLREILGDSAQIQTENKTLLVSEPDSENYTSSTNNNVIVDDYYMEYEPEITSDDLLNITTPDLIDKLRTKISDLINESEKVVKKMVGIHDGQYNDIKQLFTHFNIPYIHAGVEAEMICAALVKLGIADYCIGNDMDLFALGCPRIIRNINFRDDMVDVYYFDTILNNLGLTYSEFVDLCILLGSDYTGRLGGVKNYHILDYIKRYRSIENILSHIDELNQELIGELTEDGTQRVIRVPEPFNYIEARAIFHTEFNINQIAELFDYPLSQIYEKCADKCLDLRYNYVELDDAIQFCQEKCDRLNNMLISKKINTIIWCPIFKEQKHESFMIVRSKKSSPINITARRTDIIRDICNRNENRTINRNIGFSRVAFGSSPNHALVMLAPS